MDMSRYKKIFMEESLEHLQKLSKLSLDLEKDPTNMEVINTIFREAHSIKGMAASMGYFPISELTHKVEDLMDFVRKGEITITSQVVDVILKSVDTLEAQLQAVEKDEEIEIGLEEILTMIDEASQGKIEAKRTSKVSSEISDEETDEEEADESIKDDTEKKTVDDETKEEEVRPKEGKSEFLVFLRVNPNSEKANVKALLGVKKVSELGKIVGLSPTLNEIKRGLSSGEVKVKIVTGAKEEDIIRTLEKLPEISDFEIKKIEDEDTKIGEAQKEDVTNLELKPEDKVTSPAHDVSTEEKSPTPKKETIDKDKHLMEKILPSGEGLSEIPRTVRIGTDLLEGFINLVGELLITKARISESTKEFASPLVDESVNRLEYLIRELYAKIITVRMMPLESILSRMPRLIRDLAKEKGKEVDFSITGRDIELDRSILEELTETLVHIFRNSIDHGIEPPDERERLDKPRNGLVNLNAYRERDLVFIEATDDGKGIDPAKIKEAAIARGIIKEDQAEFLSEEDILLLTCMPNLSTQKEVSDISGRGVGMDVVKTKIESLGGNIKIESEVGKGTKIVLILPLTVAIIQALLVKAAGVTFALPLSKSVQSAEVKKEHIQKSQNQRIVLLNDEMIPLYKLSEVLNIEAAVNGKDTISMIVIEVRGRHVGLEVEEIKGSEEIFIKSLGNPLERIPGFSGVTVLGDGKPVLILDVVNLF